MKTISYAVLLLFVLSVTAWGADGDLSGLTWIDPELAAVEDPSFSIQGEYGVDRNGQAWGVQVVALGGGKFDAILYQGGLPGLGWNWDRERTQLSGTLQDLTVHLVSKDNATNATICDNKIFVTRDRKPLAQLEKIHRKSRTLGVQPPEGAIILFPDKLVEARVNGRVEKRLLVSSGMTSQEKFDDYTLHLEFRTPYKPYARSQQRGNSGVYHQGRYETQVLDSFGLEGDDNETGGIYSIAKSRINMCYPPLTWQTYDVDFTAAKFNEQDILLRPARITVRLNDVVVHQDQELPHTTTASPIKEITPDSGPIFIQYHGNPVNYRNMWVVRR